MSTSSICCYGVLEQPFLQWRKENSLNRCVYRLVERFDINHISLISYSSADSFYPLSRIHRENRWTITTDKVDRIDLNYFAYKRVGFIIVVETLQLMKLALKNLTKVNQNNKFLVIFQVPIDDPAKMVTRTMKYFFNRNKINLKIIMSDAINATRHVVYSWRQTCGKPRRDRFVHCSFGTFYNKSSLVDSRKPSVGCSVRAVHAERPPYTSPITTLLGIDNTIKGIEENLVNAVASVLRLSVVHGKAMKFGQVYANGTATENFLLLQNGSADILFGGYVSSKWRMTYFRSTTIYMNRDFSWCAPLKPIFSYDEKGIIDSRMLVYAVCFYLSVSFFIWCISNLEERESPSYRSFLDSFMNNFYVLVGTSVRQLPRSRRVRLLMFLFSITTVILNSFYSSYLTSTLISTRYSQRYENLSKILEDNLTVYTLPLAYTFFSSPETNFMSFNGDVAEKILGKIEECSNTAKCFDKVVKNNSVLLLTKMDRDYYFIRQRNGIYTSKALFHCTEQSIYKSLSTMYIRKDFPLLEEFDRVIGRVLSSGLVIKWRRDVVGEFKKHTYSNCTIKFENLVPVFQMFLWVNGFAVLVFVLELVIGRQ